MSTSSSQDRIACARAILSASCPATLKQGLFGAYDEDVVRYEIPEYGFLPFLTHRLDTTALVKEENAGAITPMPELAGFKAPLWRTIPEIVSRDSINRSGLVKHAGPDYPATNWIVVHDTGDVVFNAKEWSRIVNTDHREVSWHFMVGDDAAYQNIPLDEVAWHAGDGSRTPDDIYFNPSYKAWAIGGGNLNGIGIETVIARGTDYTVVMRRTAQLVASLLILYGLTLDHVKQHNAFSGKNCPQSMRRLGTWPLFLKLVALEKHALESLQGVGLAFRSLTPKLLSDDGRILSQVTAPMEVSYEVRIALPGETTTEVYTTTVLPA